MREIGSTGTPIDITLSGQRGWQAVGASYRHCAATNDDALETLRRSDSELRKRIDARLAKEFTRAKGILGKERPSLIALAKELFERATLDPEKVDEIMKRSSRRVCGFEAITRLIAKVFQDLIVLFGRQEFLLWQWKEKPTARNSRRKCRQRNASARDHHPMKFFMRQALRLGGCA
ncbi:hypothetical protein [Sinorhizobium fredii]|uniref:hypothetical protein n=1 Tax=Rhizobium fredii TaxID=380 RepID=UPI003519A4A4